MLRFQAQVLHQQTSASAHCEKRLAEGSKSCRLGSRSCFPPPHLPPRISADRSDAVLGRRSRLAPIRGPLPCAVGWSQRLPRACRGSGVCSVLCSPACGRGLALLSGVGLILFFPARNGLALSAALPFSVQALQRGFLVSLCECCFLFPAFLLHRLACPGSTCVHVSRQRRSMCCFLPG